MQEEYYCPKCGLQHRLVCHDTPETKIRCTQCGHRFAIKEAAQHSVNADSGDSHPTEILPTPGISHAQEGGR